MICSRLLERFPPAGFSRLMSGTVVNTSGAERGAASAGRRGVRVLDREAAAGHCIDEIDFGTFEVADAHRIDEQPDTVRLVDLVADAASFLDHEAVLKARAAATLDEHPEAAADL